MKYLVPAIALFSAVATRAQTPLDCTPPRAERFVPVVFVHEEIPDEAAGPAPVALAIDAQGKSWGTRVAVDGDPLPPLPPESSAIWHPARNHETDVPGAFWFAPPGAFHFELDPGAVAAPSPQFQIPRIAAGKFALVARVIEKGLLRVDFTIEKDGSVSEIACWDERLTRFARDFFKAILPKNGPAFAPALDRTTGKPIAVAGQLRWDLTEARRTGKNWDTDTIGWDELKGPAADFEVIVRANGSGGVDSVFLSDASLAEHPDLHDVLIAALILPLAQAEDGASERWTLQLDPALDTVRKILARTTTRKEPVMRFTPRPEYPKRLWRRGPEGYAYVRYRIRKDGAVDQIMILDATEKEFAKAARHALAQWQFEPMTFDGQPIASEVIMTLPFRLPLR